MAAIGALLAGLTPALSQLDFSFMPKGGKTLLLEFLGAPADSAELRKIAETRRSEAEWREALVARAKQLGERERRTLAAYLAVKMARCRKLKRKATWRLRCRATGANSRGMNVSSAILCSPVT